MRSASSPRFHRHQMLTARWKIQICKNTELRRRHHWPASGSGPKFAPQCSNGSVEGRIGEILERIMKTNTKTQSPAKTGVTTSGLELELIDSSAGKRVSPTRRFRGSVTARRLVLGIG